MEHRSRSGNADADADADADAELTGAARVPATETAPGRGLKAYAFIRALISVLEKR